MKSLDYGDTTYEYSLWNLDELEVRGFLISSNRGMQEWFSLKWQEAEEKANELFDPDYDDVSLPYDLFTDSVGVDPVSYFWQLSSAVVKDACSLYEVYLERAADNLVRQHGARLAKLQTEESWTWTECRAFYQSYLGCDIKPPLIENIIWMRNKMTHLRDELRTADGLADFEQRLQGLRISDPATPEEAALGLTNSPPYMQHGVEISQLQTYRMLDILRAQVNNLTLHLFPFIHGMTSNAYLDALRSGAPISIKQFNHQKLLEY